MPSARAISMMDVHMIAFSFVCAWPFGKPVSTFPDHALFRQMLAEEGEHLAPCVHRLFGSIERPVPIIEAVARAVIAVEFVVLAMLLQCGLVLVDLLGAGRAVVIAENAEQRT